MYWMDTIPLAYIYTDLWSVLIYLTLYDNQTVRNYNMDVLSIYL